eukprot:3820193-Pleurochrysis_carterae.AAC.1
MRECKLRRSPRRSANARHTCSRASKDRHGACALSLRCNRHEERERLQAQCALRDDIKEASKQASHQDRQTKPAEQRKTRTRPMTPAATKATVKGKLQAGMRRVDWMSPYLRKPDVSEGARDSQKGEGRGEHRLQGEGRVVRAQTRIA